MECTGAGRDVPDGTTTDVARWWGDAQHEQGLQEQESEAAAEVGRGRGDGCGGNAAKDPRRPQLQMLRTNDHTQSRNVITGRRHATSVAKSATSKLSAARLGHLHRRRRRQTSSSSSRRRRQILPSSVSHVQYRRYLGHAEDVITKTSTKS